MRNESESAFPEFPRHTAAAVEAVYTVQVMIGGHWYAVDSGLTRDAAERRVDSTLTNQGLPTRIIGDGRAADELEQSPAGLSPAGGC